MGTSERNHTSIRKYVMEGIMKFKNLLALAITALSLGTVGTLATTSNVSAHTWWDGTPSAVRGTWHTRNVYSSSLGFSAHAFFKAKSHSVICGFTQSAPTYLKSTYWRKVGRHAYSIHGACPGDYGIDRRMTVKFVGHGLIRVYIDGSRSTSSTPFPNLYHKV